MAKYIKSLNAARSPDVSEWAPKAVYLEQINPLFQGNGLIEALPKVWSLKDVLRHLRFYPKYEEAHRWLPNEVRLVDMLENIAHVYQPLNKHFEVYVSLARAIRGGYVGRDLFNIPTVKQTEAKLREYSK